MGISEVAPLATAGILTDIIVPEGNNKKSVIAAKDVLYFEACPPYVNIRHRSRRCLITGTLRSLELQLNPELFVRVHKSHIVNIAEVVSFQSRLNGDYDATLSDETIVRVSRNYALVFKAAFEKRNRFGPK